MPQKKKKKETKFIDFFIICFVEYTNLDPSLLPLLLSNLLFIHNYLYQAYISIKQI